MLKPIFAKIAVLGVICSAVIAAQPGLAAEFKLTPALSLSEEFNDNVRDSAVDRKSDFITRVQPGVGVLIRTPRLTGDASYSFDYHHYARGTQDDEENHYLNLRASAEVIKNLFFLDVSDTLSRVSLDVARDVTTESLYANQTDQNRATVSPYFVWRLGERHTLKTGYRFTDTSYWGAPGVDKREHRGYADLSYDPTDRLNFTAGYACAKTRTDQLDYNQHDVNLGGSYEFAEGSAIYGGLGNSWQHPSVGANVSNLFWNAGARRDFGFLVATLDTRVQYTEDPLSLSTKETSQRLSLEKRLRKGAVGVSTAYRIYRDTIEKGEKRRKAEMGCFWRGELTPRLVGSLNAAADKVSRLSASDYAYHFNGGTGLTYSFNYYSAIALNYSYIDYRREFDDASGGRRTNRIVLDIAAKF